MEHGPSDAIPPALLAGRLQGIGLPDLLWSLCRAHATGVLRVARAEIEKAVYVEDGRIVFASSSDPDDRLGELLLRSGVVGIDQLEQAVELLGSGKRLGTLLVESGSLQPDQLVVAVLNQVEGIVLDLFSWEEGDYRFDVGPLPTDELIKLNMKTGELLLRGIRQLGSFSRLRRFVGSSHKVYGLTETWRAALDGVTLSAGEESLVERLEEGDTSLDELCREVFLSNFEIYQTMWALKVLGAVEEREEPWMAPSDVTRRGSLAQVDFAELLVELARGSDTGVLYVSQGEHERSFHISGGRCVFATSNDADDSLMAYLLRRGVISLRDREETAKRLLSNKRVGTILRELGVIDEHDLRRMVRDQLSEIVYDTFRWTDAEYAFVAGPLPTVEEITLEEDLDALVARGIRRVDSWARVWQGCGGMDVRLELRPTYLKVLDAMGAGPDEWQVIAALKEPRTARQICRRLALADFRVCQILWSMRVLEGLEVCEESAAGAGEEVADVAVEVAAAVETDDGVPRETSIEETIHAIEVSLEDAPVVAPAPPSEPEDVVDVVETVAETLEETVEEAGSVPVDDAPDWDTDIPAVDAAPDRTQVVPRELIEDALRDRPVTDVAESLEAVVSGTPTDETEDESSPNATQVIPRDVVEAAVAGPGEALDDDEALSNVENEVEARDDFEEPASREAAYADVPDRGDPSELEPVSADDTAPQAAVDSVITGEFESVTAAEDGWDPGVEVDRMISRFNAAQRVVYRTIRSEVGAGAANFIRSCFAQLPAPEAAVLSGVDLQADGSWDVSGLRNAIRALRLEDPSDSYQRLIEREIEQLRMLIGEARTSDLQRQVEQVAQAEVSH